MTRINIILMLVVLLIGCGEGWANHLSVITETTDCAERNNYCGQTLEHNYLSIPQDDMNDMVCMKKMEAAMRMMEPFIPKHWVDLNLPMNGGVRTEMLASDLLTFRGAVAQWKEAKACWRKP